ncbi:MAG: hypothetical protein ACAI25_20675, partial [Planctomycetota bacterium]
MTDAHDPENAQGDYQQDFRVDKPGIVGARWWHKSLVDEGAQVQRRSVLVGLGLAGGAIAAFSVLGCCISTAALSGSTDYSGDGSSGGGLTGTLGSQNALAMQKQFGWDFGARGVALVFDGKVEGPFVRTELATLAAVMAPMSEGPNAKYYVPTLVESLDAVPALSLPDPQDGLPKPDAAPFQKLSEVLVPVCTPAMNSAYRTGEAVARLSADKKGVAILVDLPGPEAVAFAAGAASAFEPVLLLDNWPHPHGVVPSHMTLAALAYYQPRFAATKKERGAAPPVFVLDRMRTTSYIEQSDRFDNRYYARMPSIDVLAKEGVTTLLYVVASPADLPEPSDVNSSLAGSTTVAGVPTAEARAIALTDFAGLPENPEKHLYGKTPEIDLLFWDSYAPHKPVVPPPAGAPIVAHDYRFNFAG